MKRILIFLFGGRFEAFHRTTHDEWYAWKQYKYNKWYNYINKKLDSDMQAWQKNQKT